jgi:hypothetical protein
MYYTIGRDIAPLSTDLLDLLKRHTSDSDVISQDRNSLEEFQAQKQGSSGISMG